MTYLRWLSGHRSYLVYIGIRTFNFDNELHRDTKVKQTKILHRPSRCLCNACREPKIHNNKAENNYKSETRWPSRFPCWNSWTGSEIWRECACAYRAVMTVWPAANRSAPRAGSSSLINIAHDWHRSRDRTVLLLHLNVSPAKSAGGEIIPLIKISQTP